jgi:hypothetical protein
MSRVRVFLGALSAGIGDATLIAVLVLGCGVQPVVKPMDLASLGDRGVQVMRVETSERHGSKAELIAKNMREGNLSLFPKRYVLEV